MELGSVIKVNPEQARRDYPYEEIEYIDISSVGSGILHETKQIEFANAPSRAKRIIRNGDTVLATVRPNLRAFWFAQNIKENTIVSTGFAVLRANEEADPRFIYYTVTNRLFTDYLTANAKGAAYPAVDTETIERANVYLPPLPIQRKIAAILSAYDDLIENNLRRIRILEEMAQMIFKSWFIDFEPFKDTGLVKSELGPIPKGWRVGTINDCIDFHNGYAFKSKALIDHEVIDSYRVFKMGHIKKGGGLNSEGTKSWIPKIDCRHLGKYVLKKGDLLMCMTDMKGSVALLGHTALMNENDVYIVNQRVGVLRANNPFGIDYTYLYLLTNSRPFIENLRSRANSGVQVNLSTSEIKATKIVIAPKDDNMEFNEIVKPMIEMIFEITKRNQLLSSMRDLLLPKLISGEVDVSELDIKVPEEVAI